MTLDSPTNAGKHVTSNVKQHTNNSVFWLAQMILFVMMIHNFPPFIRPNVISNGMTDDLSIHQYLTSHIIQSLCSYGQMCCCGVWGWTGSYTGRSCVSRACSPPCSWEQRTPNPSSTTRAPPPRPSITT